MVSMKQSWASLVAGLLGRLGRFRFRLRLKRVRENSTFELETDVSVMEEKIESA